MLQQINLSSLPKKKITKQYKPYFDTSTCLIPANCDITSKTYQYHNSPHSILIFQHSALAIFVHYKHARQIQVD